MATNAARKIESPQLEPGIHHDIPASEYHALPYLSSSFLKKFKDCPASALMDFEPTIDMHVGSAIHAYTLEGLEMFNNEYSIMFESDLNKNTNDYKRLKGQFELQNMGKTILPAVFNKTSMMDVITGVDNALRTHLLAGSLLKQGFQEVTLIWDDADTGIRCKARLDWNPGKRVLADLKKTADVAKFKNQICSLNYDVQAGHYTNGAYACGMEPDTFIFITVEAAPPFPVKCGYLHPDWLAYGRSEANRLIGLVADCRQRREYPSFEIPGHITSLSQLQPHDLLEEWEMPRWR